MMKENGVRGKWGEGGGEGDEEGGEGGAREKGVLRGLIKETINKKTGRMDTSLYQIL